LLAQGKDYVFGCIYCITFALIVHNAEDFPGYEFRIWN